MLRCKDVAAELHVSRQTAMRIMRQEMRTINTGKSSQNPRLCVSREEFEAWKHRTARVQQPAIIKRVS